jgi:hypothetical protein
MVALMPLGVGHKNVRIELAQPKLESNYGMKGQVLGVAMVAAVWPRLQLLLQYIGWTLTREYDEDLSVEARKKVNEKYRKWETWIPVEKAVVGEEEAAKRRFEELEMVDRKRLVREWINHETGSWHCDICQGSKVLEKPPVSHARGLVDFIASKYDPHSGNFMEGTQENVFRKDKVARRGLKSYSCASTGEVYWIEDGADGVTGYMRDNGDERFHRAKHAGGFLALRKG